MTNPHLTLHPEVAQALAEHRPVIALESTVISHGLPAPTNLEVARAVQAEIRAEGCVPATIAIYNGQLAVGLDDHQLVELAELSDVRKCSRRDMAIAVARRENGATTVAGTMLIAHWAGIQMMATGGIGGVHRGYPFDESADLMELARTPVAVVCSGAKAILDLPLTREVLETRGVPVLGYQTDELPAFYSRHSGLPIDVQVDDPHQAAEIIATHLQLQQNNGLLVTVPVPAEDEWPVKDAQRVINQALEDATRYGVSGKGVTPYLLGRVSELSQGRSQRANVALLKNNARVAAKIARAMSDIG